MRLNAGSVGTTACAQLMLSTLVQDTTFTNVTAVNTIWVIGTGFVASEGLVGAPAEVLRFTTLADSAPETPSPLPAPGSWPTGVRTPLRADDLWFVIVQQVCYCMHAMIVNVVTLLSFY